MICKHMREIGKSGENRLFECEVEKIRLGFPAYLCVDCDYFEIDKKRSNLEKHCNIQAEKISKKLPIPILF